MPSAKATANALAATLAALVVLAALLIAWFYREKKRVAAALARWGESAVPDCFRAVAPSCGAMFAQVSDPQAAEFAVGAVARFVASIGACRDRRTGACADAAPVPGSVLVGYAPDSLPLAAVWAAGDAAVVVFRGTITAADLAADAKYYEADLHTHAGAPIRVHKGMYSVYLAARSQLFAAIPPPPAALFVAGHSLGAAVAFYFAREAAALGCQVTVVGIAPPRAGNSAFAAAVSSTTKSLSIVNLADVVPTLPWAFMPDFSGTADRPRAPIEYAHVEPVAVFDNRRSDPLACHALPAYFAGLPAAVVVPTAG